MQTLKQAEQSQKCRRIRTIRTIIQTGMLKDDGNWDAERLSSEWTSQKKKQPSPALTSCFMCHKTSGWPLCPHWHSIPWHVTQYSSAAAQPTKKPCHAWVPIADHDQDAAGRHPPSSSEFRNFKPEMLSASVSSENTTAYRIVQDGAGWCNMQGTWMASWCIMSLSFLGDGRAHSCGRPQLEEFVDVSPESESRVNPLLFCAVLDVLGICRIWW